MYVSKHRPLFFDGVLFKFLVVETYLWIFFYEFVDLKLKKECAEFYEVYLKKIQGSSGKEGWDLRMGRS